MIYGKKTQSKWLFMASKKNRVYSVNRGDSQSIQAVFLRLSYLAKKKTVKKILLQ